MYFLFKTNKKKKKIATSQEWKHLFIKKNSNVKEIYERGKKLKGRLGNLFKSQGFKAIEKDKKSIFKVE